MSVFQQVQERSLLTLARSPTPSFRHHPCMQISFFSNRTVRNVTGAEYLHKPLKQRTLRANTVGPPIGAGGGGRVEGWEWNLGGLFIQLSQWEIPSGADCFVCALLSACYYPARSKP